MSSSCTHCDNYLQSLRKIKRISIDQTQTISDLNNKNKNEQELVKKLSTEVDILIQTNNDLNERLKAEIGKEEKYKQLEKKFDELELELENIRQNNNDKAKYYVNSLENEGKNDKIQSENENSLEDLILKLQKYKLDNEELIKNIEIKDNYIKTLNKDGQNNNSILIENRKLILLNEELKSTLDNMRKECKTCQQLKEQKQELKGTNIKYEMEIKALKRKANDLDKELKEVKSFNSVIQNENIKFSAQIDKYKELQPGKVEELSRTVDHLKRLIFSDTKQRKKEINKTCEICKVTANLIFDCFKGNESYRAVNSAGGGKLLEAYKRAKFTLLKHLQNNLITHMFTVEGESDLLKSIEEIIEKDKSHKIPGKKVKPNETDGESSPSFMTADSEDNLMNNELSVDNIDHDGVNNTQTTSIRDRVKRNRMGKTSKSSHNSSAEKSMNNVNSNEQETVEIIALEEIFPEDSLKYRSKTSADKFSTEIQNVEVFSKENSKPLSVSSCPAFTGDSRRNNDEGLGIFGEGSSSNAERSVEHNNYKQGKGAELELLKPPEIVSHIDEFPESCRDAEYISTPFCIDNDIEITRTCNQQCSAPRNSVKLIKIENAKENQNWNNQQDLCTDFPSEVLFHVQHIKPDIIDCELYPSIDGSPLNLSLKPNPFVPKTELDNIIDYPLNLSTKNPNQSIRKIDQSKDSEIKFVHSTPILKFRDHYKENLLLKQSISNTNTNSTTEVLKQVKIVKEMTKNDPKTFARTSKNSDRDLINNERNMPQIIEKSIKKRKIINDENREIFSKKLKLNDTSRVEDVKEKHPEININILQQVANGLEIENIRRYQEMVTFTSTNCILPKLSLAAASIDSIDQSKMSKTSFSNCLLTNVNEMDSEAPNQVGKLHRSENSGNSSNNRQESSKSATELENSRILLENTNKEEKEEQSKDKNCNIGLIEDLFRELMQQNQKDFHSIIKRRIVIKTESQAQVYVDNFLNWFLLDKYKSFDRKLTADIAYYLILSLYSQCNPIYDYYYNGLISAFSSKGFNPILFMTNLAFLIFVQNWDLLMEFLVDLIKLPNISLLAIVKWIKPGDVFLPRLTARYSSVIDLLKRIVIYEYSSANTGSDSRKSFENIPLEIQKFWLNGETTKTLQPIIDMTSLLELTNQIVVEYKSQKSKLKLDN